MQVQTRKKYQQKPFRYRFVDAPEGYPGKIYTTGNRRYIYEHHFTYWKHTGTIVPEGYVLTFDDGDPSNCNISNLTLLTRSAHTVEQKTKDPIILKCFCGEYFATRNRRKRFCSRKCRKGVPMDALKKLDDILTK
jgi:hypothetical protein